jgi:hypothetical protein
VLKVPSDEPPTAKQTLGSTFDFQQVDLDEKAPIFGALCRAL